MVTKTDAKDVKVDWDKVNKATEIRRTYLITTNDGREFFKMYKPSEARKIFKAKGWKGTIVSKVDRALRKKDPSFKESIRGRNMYDMGKRRA